MNSDFILTIVLTIFGGLVQIVSPLSSVTTIADFKSWNPPESCKSVNFLFHAKEKVISKLNHALHSKQDKDKLSEAQRKTLVIFQDELNDTEQAVYDALNGLKRLLQEDYKSVMKIKRAIAQRLESFKELTLQQEEQVNAISEAEKELLALAKHGKHNGTRLQQMIGEVLSGISFAADKLENQLNDNTFEKNRKNKGANVEAVIRLSDAEEARPSSSEKRNNEKADAEREADVGILVDSQNNQFVLAKAKDATIPHEDLHLIKDIIYIVLLSFIGCWFCALVHIPTMFGPVLSGMILGPSGNNVIKDVVQVETLGEFGVFFILFSLGLEFSPVRIKKVLKVAVGGSTLMMSSMIIIGVVWGSFFGILPQQSLFVAACLSLSSTPLVSKFVENKNEDHSVKEHTNGNEDYRSSLLGILVMQDIHLGLLIAVLPALAGHKGVAPHRSKVHELLHGSDIVGSAEPESELVNLIWTLLEVTGSMIGLWLLCVGLAKIFTATFYKHLQNLGSIELLTLGTISVAFSLLMLHKNTINFILVQLTEHLGISMELGCFIAGVVISSQGDQLVKQVIVLVEPIRDLLSSLFFASIGLHVFPSFVANELTVIVVLTLGVVATKFLVGVVVLRIFFPHKSKAKYIVAAGLAQVSEFSFVLGSRGRRVQLISREVYLIILSVTSVSIMLAPLLWRISLWRFGSTLVQNPGDKKTLHLKPV